MAQRRMVSLQIVDSDAFLDMPASTQALYMHLCLRADDEGFIGNCKKIMRMIGVQDDELKVLIAKRFVLEMAGGVVVIKHWLIHNTIRMDRFHPTKYEAQKKTLVVKKNGGYTERKDTWQPDGNQMEPEAKLSEAKLSKRVQSAEAVDNPKAKPETIKQLDDMRAKLKKKGIV